MQIHSKQESHDKKKPELFSSEDEGELGVAEDTSDACIDGRQIAPIKIVGKLKDGEQS